ncbi:MAG: tRNA (adenosine(37)-N6)-dimethylallyltransferase MiaA [Acidimicrobiia bacterium]|nr:tRNA (adenosine(37)-N6)-dimethylallyltransferase MiaA [Acidimicrobiia bacterium]
MDRARPPTAAIVGPTASGKSEVAMTVARYHRDVELVAVDAMQVYRGMDIGTAKPTAAERAEVAHHLLDLAEPSEECSVAGWRAAADEALRGIREREHRAVLVGGTGLYLRAVVDQLELPGRWPEVRAELDAEPDERALHTRLAGLDPVAAGRMEPTNRRRVVRALEVTLGSGQRFSDFGPGLEAYPRVPTLQVGLRPALGELDRRIADRVAAMAEAGLVEEVAGLLDRPGGLGRTASQALGYREVAAALRGATSVEEALEETVRRTRAYARRQLRWFRRDPRIAWCETVGEATDRLGQWATCA